MCLQAHHFLMWDVIENGPSPIIGERLVIAGTSLGKATLVPQPKDPSEYTSEDRKIAGLDNFTKGVISCTIKGVYLAKIRQLNIAKEMWDTLKAIS